MFERTSSSSAVPAGELLIPQREESEQPAAAAGAPLVPVGKTAYGIYFTEILEHVPLMDALTAYCARKNILRAWTEVKSAFEFRGSMADLQFSSVLNSIDMMGARAESAYIPLPSDNYVKKSQLIDLLLDLGIKKKGETISEIKLR